MCAAHLRYRIYQLRLDFLSFLSVKVNQSLLEVGLGLLYFLVPYFTISIQRLFDILDVDNF